MTLLSLPGTERLIKRRANQFDTIYAMRKVAHESAKEPYFRKLINKHNLYNSPDALKRIFDFCFYNTYYEKDPEQKQLIRSGLRSLKDERANCVDYCVLLSSFLLNLNIPHSFRMVSTDPTKPDNFGHIYVIANGSTILDLVIGQDQEGKEIYKRAKQRTNKFNTEIPFIKNYDVKVF